MKEILIGEIIKQRRLELNLTQEELCEGICEPPTMSRIENGKQTPSRSKLNLLLQRLGLPSNKYYALMSENELEIEKLKSEIVSCNMRNQFREGLEKINVLSQLIDADDQISQQFILRSKALLGKIENDDIVEFSFGEKINLLDQAMKITIPHFDMGDIGRHWYSLDEIKIINQLGKVYAENGHLHASLDIYQQLMNYIKRRLVINLENIATAILISYNYSCLLCKDKKYDDAQSVAFWGWDNAVKWGRSTHLGGLLYVLAESAYHIGQIEDRKEYYIIQSFYAYKIMKNKLDTETIRNNIKEYFSIDI